VLFAGADEVVGGKKTVGDGVFGGCGPQWRGVFCLRDNKQVTQAIIRDKDTMHGVPVFRGTRVPVQTLFDYLEGGDTLEDFLAGFPTVSRALALQALGEGRTQTRMAP
jgi:uncharacterized protein (DUF433 family)